MTAERNSLYLNRSENKGLVIAFQIYYQSLYFISFKLGQKVIVGCFYGKSN